MSRGNEQDFFKQYDTDEWQDSLLNLLDDHVKQNNELLALLTQYTKGTADSPEARDTIAEQSTEILYSWSRVVEQLGCEYGWDSELFRHTAAIIMIDDDKARIDELTKLHPNNDLVTLETLGIDMLKAKITEKLENKTSSSETCEELCNLYGYYLFNDINVFTGNVREQ